MTDLWIIHSVSIHRMQQIDFTLQNSAIYPGTDQNSRILVYMADYQQVQLESLTNLLVRCTSFHSSWAKLHQPFLRERSLSYIHFAQSLHTKSDRRTYFTPFASRITMIDSRMHRNLTLRWRQSFCKESGNMGAFVSRWPYLGGVLYVLYYRIELSYEWAVTFVIIIVCLHQQMWRELYLFPC